MNTPFTVVYDTFMSKVNDYKFIKLNNQGRLEEMLLKYLKSSIVRFRICLKDLSLDTINESFEVNLDLDEIEILAVGMVLIYTTSKVNDIKNKEMILTRSEYIAYSQANHLRELQGLKSSCQLDFSHLLTEYSIKYMDEFL